MRNEVVRKRLKMEPRQEETTDEALWTFNVKRRNQAREAWCKG